MPKAISMCKNQLSAEWIHSWNPKVYLCRQMNSFTMLTDQTNPYSFHKVINSMIFVLCNMTDSFPLTPL